MELFVVIIITTFVIIFMMCTYIVWANYLKYTRAIYNDQICGEQFQ